MRQAALVVLLSAGASAILFGNMGGGGCCGGGGGGGGGCCCCGGGGGGGGGFGGFGGGGGCGGRKKREANNLVSSESVNRCNNEELQAVLRGNMKADVKSSLAAIREKLNNEHDFTVLCGDKKLQFIANVDDYCQVQAENVHCAIFRIKVKEQVKEAAAAPLAVVPEAAPIATQAKEAHVEPSIASKAEAQVATAANNEKKEEAKPEVQKN